jgi:hypothetical protein
VRYTVFELFLIVSNQRSTKISILLPEIIKEGYTLVVNSSQFIESIAIAFIFFVFVLLRAKGTDNL